jgi:hypothetical protein
MLVYLPTENGLRAVNPAYVVMVEPAVLLGETKPTPGRCFVLVATGQANRTFLVHKDYVELCDEIERALHGLPPCSTEEA